MDQIRCQLLLPLLIQDTEMKERSGSGQGAVREVRGFSLGGRADYDNENDGYK